MSSEIKKIIAEYSEDYCLLLEAAYGNGMMSEGGEEAINHLFARDDLHGKSLLDIGFGLAGVAFYLAKNFKAHVTGLEISPWMVEEAQRRTPEQLKQYLSFQTYDPFNPLNFADNSFDVVYSKGVLAHLSDKRNLFKEVHRVLKPQGVLIINDWLSPTQGQWGGRLLQMCEMEGLTIFAESPEGYHQLLEDAGFKEINISDENSNYCRYNLDIVKRLNANKHQHAFDESAIEEAITGYQLIADSIKDNEVLVRTIRAIKSL